MPVVGFRSWVAGSAFKIGVGPTHRLRAINDSYGEWRPGVNLANCYRHRDMFGSYGVGIPAELTPEHGPVPSADCTCGFYVLTDLDKVPWEFIRRDFQTAVSTTTTGVVGAVVGWGRVVQHGDEGWRAEKVQVIAMLDTKLSPEHLKQTQEVAETYGVPVVGRTALELLAKEYGDRLVEVDHAATERRFSADTRA